MRCSEALEQFVARCRGCDENMPEATSFGELNVGFGGKKDLLLLSPLADDVDEKRRVADSILMA